MYIFKIVVRAPHHHTEVSPDSLDITASMVVDLVSGALREVLRLPIVEHIEVIYLPLDAEEDDDLLDDQDDADADADVG